MVCFWPIKYGKSDGMRLLCETVSSTTVMSALQGDVLLLADFNKASEHSGERPMWQGPEAGSQ